MNEETAEVKGGLRVVEESIRDFKNVRISLDVACGDLAVYATTALEAETVGEWNLAEVCASLFHAVDVVSGLLAHDVAGAADRVVNEKKGIDCEKAERFLKLVKEIRRKMEEDRESEKEKSDE